MIRMRGNLPQGRNTNFNSPQLFNPKSVIKKPLPRPVNMSENNKPNSRLTRIKDIMTGNKTASTIPWDPESTKFPTRSELPAIEGAPKYAAWVWGKDDFLGRLNLLTSTRVKEASKEIQTGERIPLK
jgi:hypothetical protein